MTCPECKGRGWIDERCESAIAGMTVPANLRPVCDACDGTGVIARPHHPLSTPAAARRLDAIHAFMLVWQEMNGEPPTLAQIAGGCGPSSTGLVAIYMRRLASAGRVRKLGGEHVSRYHHRWEAIAAAAVSAKETA